MSRYGIHDYRSHYVCFTCRRSVKLEYRRVRATCAQCGASLVPMGRDFHAPRREATNQWRKLRLLVLAGVTFDSCGCDGPGSRPRTLGEARRFVAAARARLDPRPAFARRATTG